MILAGRMRGIRRKDCTLDEQQAGTERQPLDPLGIRGKIPRAARTSPTHRPRDRRTGR